MLHRATLAAAAALAAFPIQAQVLTPVVVFSVHDEPVDARGDSLNTALPGLIRREATRRDVACQEFDVRALLDRELVSATLTGSIAASDLTDCGTRTFHFYLYGRGNGRADLFDHVVSAPFVGTGSYQPPSTASFTYSFDVTEKLRLLIDCGGTAFVGLRVVAWSLPNLANTLDASVSRLTVTMAGPAARWTDLGSASFACGTPRLTGTGVLAAGNPTTVTLCGACPNSGLGALVIGFSRIDVPLLGVTIVPMPDFAPATWIDGLGMRHTTLVFPPPGGGGMPVYFQFVMFDPMAPDGVAASNALMTIAP